MLGTDRLAHVSGPNGDLYCHLLVPEEARICVVICSSILGEFEANYHRERLLAAALADAGMAVARFHYAGEGNSFGEREAMTLESMTEDGRAVAAHVSDLGYQRCAFVGTRVGCFVAATLAGQDREAPLVFWEPIRHASSLLRDAERRRRMSQLSSGPASNTSVAAETTTGTVSVDLFGYDVYPPLRRSLEEANLLEFLPVGNRRVFVGRFSVPKTSDPLTEALLSRGFEVDQASFGFSEAWWYQSEQEPESGDLVASTAAWVEATSGGRS